MASIHGEARHKPSTAATGLTMEVVVVVLKRRRRLMLRHWSRSWWPLALLLFIADASSFSLRVPHLTKVKPNSASPKGVTLRRSTVLLIGRPKTAYECIQGAPRLAEGTGAGSRRVRMTKERAPRVVNLSLPKLIQVPEKLQHMSPAAAGQRQGWAVVPEVLTKRVPVPSFLILVPAKLTVAAAAAARGCHRGRGR